MKTPERIEEGWVKFSRYHCTEGCIDVWMGDCVDNPNNETKSHWNLNAFATFIRLNGEGEWFSTKIGVKGFIGEMSEITTSEEIWDELSKYNYEENGK